jgi:hypothetical protein
MPYKIIKKPNGKYKVKNLKSGKIVAKDTTKTKAQKQVRFLHYLDNKK